MTPAKRSDFLGVPIDTLTMAETMAAVERAILTRERLLHVSLNVSKFVYLQKDLELRRDVVTADLVGVDGAGIILGARLLGIRVPERVTGVDLMEKIIEGCATRGWKPYLLGATQENLDQAVARLIARHPALRFAGLRNGYFQPQDERDIVAAINRSGADCLFIGMPTPRKERFIATHRDELRVPVIMGVGGSIDVVAGYVSRAPGWIQSIGFEWAYRLAP